MSNNHKRFEVSIYNQHVRELDEQNKNHPNYSSEWAHLHFLTFEGENEDDIIRQVRKKHPERKGFIIDKVVELKEFEFVKPVGQRF